MHEFKFFSCQVSEGVINLWSHKILKKIALLCYVRLHVLGKYNFSMFVNIHNLFNEKNILS